MKNIKSVIIKTALSLFVFVGFSACEDNIFDKELYEKIFSLLSNDNQVFNMVHPFEEGGSERNISAYCSGTKPIEEDVLVTIALDGDSLFNLYNEREYDLDSASFAKLLSPDRYKIESFEATMKANQDDPYVTLPITVDVNGLSPDSTYFIPLRITSVSGGYKINEKKRQILYRPLLANDYAEQLNTTYYRSKGYSDLYKLNGKDIAEGTTIEIGSSKILYPLSKNQVRASVDLNSSTDKDGNPSLENIDKYSITLTVDSDNKITITPYGDKSVYEIEQLDDDPDYYNNEFREENGKECFFISYRYREKNYPIWKRIHERLRRDD